MTQTTAPTNEVKIEELGPTLRRLTITVPAETINEKIEDSMAALATETALPGFRKGRAPKKLLERRFGEAVRSETKNQLLADAYSQAVEEHDIKAIGEPEPAEGFDIEKLEVERGKPLTFTVDVEVAPEFDLPDLDGIEVKRPDIEITDEMIEQEIETQCLRHGTPQEKKGDFGAGDRLVCSATATKKGEDEPFFRTDETLVVVPGSDDDGRGQVLGLMIDNLATLLKGGKVGDDVTIETTGPDAHEREDIRGADITITLHIKQAFHVEPAELQTILDYYGMESEELLREQIRMALEQRRDQEIAEAMRQQVYDHLLETVDFALPEKMSQNQVVRSLERSRLDMLQRGMTEEQVEQQLAEMRSASEAETRQRLKLMFILNKLADDFEVQVSEQEVNGRIAQMAGRHGVRPEQLRQNLAQRGALGQVAMQVREQKAADRVVAQARVEDVSRDEWQKIAEQKAKKRGGASAGSSSSRTTKKKTTRKKTSASSSRKTTKKKTSSSRKTTKKS